MFFKIEQLLSHRARASVRRKLRPSIEGLEDRKLLYATLGDLWSIPTRITYSFVPDGTNLGGLSSNLFSTLNAQGTTAAWQLVFAKSAANWSSYAHINIAQVSDNGADLGGTGNQQGDPQFGDIRIAMANEGNNGVLASTFLPPNANGGSVAGDIILNSYYTFHLNADYDLQTVALHEFGHALGLAHSGVTTAAMYPYYQGLRQAPSSDDVAGIQSVYGAYPSDTDTNKTINTATDITSLTSPNAQIAVGSLNLAGPFDQDWFYVTAPANTTGSMTVTMQASGLSMVNPRLAIYNSAKMGLSQFSSITNLDGNATLTINGVTPGQGFYIRAAAATSPGAFGSYGLLLNFGSDTQAPIAPPNTTVAATLDQGGGTSSQSISSSSFSAVVADMRQALVTYNSSPVTSLATLTADTAQLQSIFTSVGDTTSQAYLDLTRIESDLANVNINKMSKDLNEFLGTTVQVGSLIGFGDSLTVSAAYHPGHPVASNSHPSGTHVIEFPQGPRGTHKNPAHHSTSTHSIPPTTTGHHVPVHSATSFPKMLSGHHGSRAFKLKSGH